MGLEYTNCIDYRGIRSQPSPKVAASQVYACRCKYGQPISTY